jgi:TPP-dependent pyruvate/acetoin dehydrogenase alpha subunit
MASGISSAPATPANLGRDDLIRAFRIMYLSRRMDDREIAAEAPEPHLFPDQRRGHEAINRGRHGAASRRRLVLSRITATARWRWRWV